MAEFVYKLRNHSGDIVEGTIIADSRGEALDRVSSSNEGVVLLLKEKKSLNINLPFLDNLLHKIKLKDKIMFTRNLAGMLKSGLPVYRALSVLEKQAKNVFLAGVLRSLMKTVNDGGTLSEGLASYPKVFPPFFVAMVHAGEESGSLPESLQTIETYLQKSYDLRRKVKSAMMYPAVIISVVIVVGILMFIFVVPGLISMFADIGGELPKSTQFIIWLTNMIQNQALVLLLSVVVIVGSMVYGLRSPKLKPLFHRLFLKIPLIKNLIKEVNTARTARTLSSLLSSGVSLMRSLEITQEVVQNLVYKKVIATASQRVSKGVSLSQVFAENPNLFPPMVSEMVEVGEETGHLSDMLSDISVFYEEEVENKTKNLSTIIEPMLMVFIGGAVGFFAVAMIQPMYSVLENF